MTRGDSQDLIALVGGRHGHFRLESGHHGDLWLDLDTLFLRPARLAPFVADLARLLSEKIDPDAVCGPLLGGGLIASAVATLLDIELYVAESVPRAAGTGAGELFQARYAVPAAVRGCLPGRRVAVVDDVVNAASATRAAVADLRMAGADVRAVGALLVLGDSAAEYAEREQLALVHVAATANRIWEPNACPLCAAGQPLEDPGSSSVRVRRSGASGSS
jgi:orotate phosphoribosyltransferase